MVAGGSAGRGRHGSGRQNGNGRRDGHGRRDGPGRSGRSRARLGVLGRDAVRDGPVRRQGLLQQRLRGSMPGVRHRLQPGNVPAGDLGAAARYTRSLRGNRRLRWPMRAHHRHGRRVRVRADECQLRSCELQRQHADGGGDVAAGWARAGRPRPAPVHSASTATPRRTPALPVAPPAPTASRRRRIAIPAPISARPRGRSHRRALSPPTARTVCASTASAATERAAGPAKRATTRDNTGHCSLSPGGPAAPRRAGCLRRRHRHMWRSMRRDRRSMPFPVEQLVRLPRTPRRCHSGDVRWNG